MTVEDAQPQSRMNEDHRKAIVGILRQLDRLLNEALHSIDDAKSDTPFPAVTSDIDPPLQTRLELGLARLREATRTFLARNHIEHGAPPDAQKAILVTLQFAFITLHDLHPDRLGGYGALGGEAMDELRQLFAEVSDIFHELAHASSKKPLK